MQVTDETFQQCVLESAAPVLVDFWASWCPPCKAMEPLVDRLRSELAPRTEIVSLNIDRNPAAASKYNIESVPAFVLFAGGKEVARRTGAQTENQLRSLIAAAPAAAHSSSDNSAASDKNWIAVVSGLPRSGTSMMMQMLTAGGIDPVTDGQRTADEDNPNGYFELEAVKNMENDVSWLASAEGKVVKIVYKLLPSLPADRAYRVLFMRRRMKEILASQRAMLARGGAPAGDEDDARMARLFELELRGIQHWLAAQANFSVLQVDYNCMMKNPVQEIGRVNRFLDGKLDTRAMAAIVDEKLYRQRAA